MLTLLLLNILPHAQLPLVVACTDGDCAYWLLLGLGTAAVGLFRPIAAA